MCNKIIKTITNPFGEEEHQYCVKEENHKYVCRFKEDYSVFDDDKTYVEGKIYNMAYSTAGSTASNSPILNRASRFSPPRVISKQEEIRLKEQQEYRVGVRKTEVSTFEQCKKVEVDLYNDALSIYDGDGCDCPLCGVPITWEQFTSRDRTDGNSVQGCHLDPLEEGTIQHYVGNVKWGHRDCNQMQGDRSIQDMEEKLEVMLSHIRKIKNEVTRRENKPTIQW
jgi:hypothetical protein|tara:strand:+ start:150 stop:821 length:672 start_codon:yes stop_codon:yes gene_type:complete